MAGVFEEAAQAQLAGHAPEQLTRGEVDRSTGVGRVCAVGVAVQGRDAVAGVRRRVAVDRVGIEHAHRILAIVTPCRLPRRMYRRASSLSIRLCPEPQLGAGPCPRRDFDRPIGGADQEQRVRFARVSSRRLSEVIEVFVQAQDVRGLDQGRARTEPGSSAPVTGTMRDRTAGCTEARMRVPAGGRERRVHG